MRLDRYTKGMRRFDRVLSDLFDVKLSCLNEAQSWLELRLTRCASHRGEGELGTEAEFNTVRFTARK